MRPSLEVIAGLGPVEHLSRLSDVTDRMLETVGNLDNLRQLRFSASPFVTDDGLAHLGALSRLEVLSIVGGRFLGDGLEHLVETGPPIRRVRLDSDPWLGNDALLFLGELGTLEEISLSNAGRISDEGLSYLGDLAELRRLDLSCCTRLGNRGVEALASLPSLVELNLQYTSVGDRGIASLVELPIERLTLRACSLVTDSAVESLIRMRSLANLCLSQSGISPAGLRRLREALPGTQITPRAIGAPEFGV